jgi:S1-C subfamily serine protease
VCKAYYKQTRLLWNNQKGNPMSATLHELSTNIAELVAAADKYIVRVEGRRRLSATGIVYRADGLIVTANHIVERDEDLMVGLGDGSSHRATLVGRDPSSDLALLRVEANNLPAATWSDPASLRVGHIVLALGRPGRTVQATLGVISALGGSWRTAAGADIEQYLQTDVAMYPGFSGGPLLAADGSFAGLNSSALVHGISVALPAPTIHRVVETLVTHGRVPRGYLGIGIQPVRLAGNLQERAGQETGLMVMSVENGSPAEKAGLLQGDILVTLNGTALRQVDDLQSLLSSTPIGTSVPTRVARSGDIHDLTVTIGQGK